MKTDELILELAKSARPVTPLAPPSVRVWRWLGMAATLAAVAVSAFIFMLAAMPETGTKQTHRLEDRILALKSSQ